MKDSLSTAESETFCVLDLETAPDPGAMALMRRVVGDKVGAIAHRITCATTLTTTLSPDGSWTPPALETNASPDVSELSILYGIDATLEIVSRCNGTLVTFNGCKHDIPVLRRRAARHLLFDVPGIDAASGKKHFDLMLRATRGWRDEWPSLRAACAGLGIPVSDLTGRPEHAPPPNRRKCETDVICTFILLLFELAMKARDGVVLVNGWRRIAEMIDELGPEASHLRHFSRVRPTLESLASGVISPR